MGQAHGDRLAACVGTEAGSGGGLARSVLVRAAGEGLEQWINDPMVSLSPSGRPAPAETTELAGADLNGDADTDGVAGAELAVSVVCQQDRVRLTMTDRPNLRC